jgi:hypothetical protein
MKTVISTEKGDAEMKNVKGRKKKGAILGTKRK